MKRLTMLALLPLVCLALWVALWPATGSATSQGNAACKTLYPHQDCLSVADCLSDVLVDPANPKIIVAFICNVAWVSRDSGRSWVTHRLPPAVSEGIAQAPGDPRGFAFSKDGTAIVEPAANSAVEISHDLGASWTRATPTGIGGEFGNIVADPASPTGLWACADPAGGAFENGIAHSENDGVTWTFIHSFGAHVTCGQVAPEPGGGKVVLATVDLNGTHRVLFRSGDGGQTWQRVPGIYLTVDSLRIQQEIAWDPTRPNTVVAIAGTRASDTASRVLRSTNAGMTWHVVKTLRLRPHPKDCGFTRLAFSHSGIALANFACEKDEHSGFLKSRDHGARWTTVKIPRAPHGGVWGFFPSEAYSDAEVLIPQGSSGILFYSSAILGYVGRAPFWHLSRSGRSMTWYGGFRPAS